MVIQFAMLLVTFLDIPVARQTIGFVYLSFVPGALILEILKWDSKSKLSFILYAIGLSIAFVMFVGALVNALFPFFGVSAPLSTPPLIVTIGTILLAASFVAYKRGSSAEANSVLNFHISLRQVLGIIFLSSIPLLAVFGAIYPSNLLLFIMIISIALLVVVSSFSKIIPSQLKPFVIFVIALSLLFQIPFLSQHLVGWDIFQEFYVFRLTQTNSLWNTALVSSAGEVVVYNGMLSVTVLPTVYSNLLNLSGEWVFRVVYLLFYSLVPLTMYQMYKQPYGKSVAFLAVFYFILFPRFYMEERRQIIGELFFVLLISLVLNTRISVRKKLLISIVFGAALVVSHYSIFYIFMFCALFALTMSTVEGKLRRPKRFKIESKKLINTTFLLIMLLFGISWYFYVTPDLGTNFLQVAKGMVTSITTDFGDLQARGSGVSDFVTPDFNSLSLTSMADVIINKVPYILVFVGFFALVKKFRILSLSSEYVYWLSANIIILLMLLVVPSFAPAFLPHRFYHISLIFLAPVCIFGGMTLLRLILKKFKKIKRKRSLILGVLSIFFIVIFFFKVGFIAEITNDTPSNISISFNRMKASNDPIMLDSLYSAYSPEEDMWSAIWLSKFPSNDSGIYADTIARKHVLVAYGMIVVDWDHNLHNDTIIIEDSYVYLRFFNSEGLINDNGVVKNATGIMDQLNSKAKIYSNGKSEIYYSLP